MIGHWTSLSEDICFCSPDFFCFPCASMDSSTLQGLFCSNEDSTPQTSGQKWRNYYREATHSLSPQMVTHAIVSALKLNHPEFDFKSIAQHLKLAFNFYHNHMFQAAKEFCKVKPSSEIICQTPQQVHPAPQDFFSPDGCSQTGVSICSDSPPFSGHQRRSCCQSGTSFQACSSQHCSYLFLFGHIHNPHLHRGKETPDMGCQGFSGIYSCSQNESPKEHPQRDCHPLQILLASGLLLSMLPFLLPKWNFSTEAPTFFIFLILLSLLYLCFLATRLHFVTTISPRRENLSLKFPLPSNLQLFLHPCQLGTLFLTLSPLFSIFPPFAPASASRPRTSPDVLMIRITVFLGRNIQFHSPEQHFYCVAHVFGLLSRNTC